MNDSIGGLVFAYSDSQFRFWYPKKGSLILVDQSWGKPNTQHTSQKAQVTVEINKKFKSCKFICLWVSNGITYENLEVITPSRNVECSIRTRIKMEHKKTIGVSHVFESCCLIGQYLAMMNVRSPNTKTMVRTNTHINLVQLV